MSRPPATLRLRGISGPIDAQIHFPPTRRSGRLVVAFVDPATGVDLCSTLGAIVVAISPMEAPDMQRLLEWIADHAVDLGASGDAIAVAGIGDSATGAGQLVAAAALAGWPPLELVELEPASDDPSRGNDPNPQEHEMNMTVTDDQVRQLAGSARPYSLALLWWGPERFKDGADATEREHQRRMVSLRADGVVAILCPVGSETLAGMAIMNVPPQEASEILDGDPCVQSGMMRREVHLCHGFPGDAVPAASAS